MSVSETALKMLKKLLQDSLSSTAASNLMKFFESTYQILTQSSGNKVSGQENLVKLISLALGTCSRNCICLGYHVW